MATEQPAEAGPLTSRDVTRIQRELTAIARRGRARSRANMPNLSLVEHSLLDYLHDNPGARAADIAAHFQLDKSTVSRQLAGLARDGLVRSDAGAEGRGKQLRLTRRGMDTISASLRSQRQALRERLEGWTAREVRDFAEALERFNRE